MRVKVRGKWVIAYQDGQHRILENGCVVYENEHIIFVGKDYLGSVDQIIDAMDCVVSPGFIDTHVHSGHRALHKLLTDGGRSNLYGQPYMDVTIAREGASIKGYPNYITDKEKAVVSPEVDLHSEFTIVELLRNGVTTFVELGAHLIIQKALWKQCERLGIRGYLGAGYDSGRWSADNNGNLSRVPYEDQGIGLFNDAVNFIKEIKKHNNDLINGILVPREVENCSVEILRKTVEAAEELNVPMATHAGYSVIEFHEIVREHGMTHIELLDSVGMLKTTLNIGHANFISDNPKMNYSGGNDLKKMGDNCVSISHCPINIVRRGRGLDTWKKYKNAGVNMTIGSDTYPRDMIMNLREASYHGKVMSHDLQAASAHEVFHAATVGGAESLGRNDIGRLQKGARADLILIKIVKGDSLRYGPIWDPIRSIVECGIGDDVDTVIVNGKIRMKEGVIPGVDFKKLNETAQSFAEDIWPNLQDWDQLKRTAHDLCPIPAYTLKNE